MKRLITERDVAQRSAGTEIALDRDTVVTPAARDLAFIRGIRFVESGAPARPVAAKCPGCSGGSGPCTCPPGARCASDVTKLADGDYLLEIRGGKPHIRRIGP